METNEQTYETRILRPLAGDHFEGGAASLEWIHEGRTALSFALMEGFDSEDESMRSACYVLLQDLDVLTRAAADAAASGKPVPVHVRMQPGLADVDYLDAVRDIALVMRLALDSPCEGGWAAVGFSDLSDLLREHMDAIGEMELRPRALGLGRHEREHEVRA